MSEYPDELSNLEIDQLVQRISSSGRARTTNATNGLKDYRGTYSKDSIPPDIIKSLQNNDWMILNLQDEDDGGGTHWVCFVVRPHKLWYFDSYGLYPPKVIRRIANQLGRDDVMYQDEQLQTDSKRCGWFCLLFIKLIQEGHHFKDIGLKSVNEKTVKEFKDSL